MVSRVEVGSADGHKDDVRIGSALHVQARVSSVSQRGSVCVTHRNATQHMFTELRCTIVIHHFRPHELSLSSKRFLQTFDYNDAFC